MFKIACKEALKYTRPIIIGKKYYQNDQIFNDIATLIVLNQYGDILTTKEIAEYFLTAKDTNEIFNKILNEMKSQNNRQIKKTENKYGLNKNTITNVELQIIDVAKSISNLEIIFHKYLNLAIIKSQNKDLLIKSYPKFYNGNYYQAESILGLGYPFPEYETFMFDSETNKILTTCKRMNFPSFPISGMITRNILDEQNEVSQFEISNQIYRGMSGGPILNKNGQVLGIMSANKTIIENEKTSTTLGIVINSNEIIKFLKENNIECEVINEK